jgi:hypothetical protein
MKNYEDEAAIVHDEIADILHQAEVDENPTAPIEIEIETLERWKERLA